MMLERHSRGAVTWLGRVPLANLVTEYDALTSTMASGRVSDTPDAPVELCLREGVAGRFEIVDGHHRIAAAVQDGRSEIAAVIRDYVDDEPYAPPFAVIL